MRSVSFHLGYQSAFAGHRPLRFFEAFEHDEGWAFWAGPLGLLVYTRAEARPSVSDEELADHVRTIRDRLHQLVADPA